MRSRRAAGFTLIEILIAMVVLIIGLVGILALFPVGMKNAVYALGDTTAANHCESLHSAIVAAHRMAVVPPPPPPGGTPSRAKVTIVHDLALPKLVAGKYDPTLPGRYTLELPFLADPLNSNYVNHPGTGEGTKIEYVMADGASGGDGEVFLLGGDPWMGAAVQDIHAKSDLTDPYRQYGFYFNVRKLDTNPPGGNSYLYEYNIHVLRLLGTGLGDASAGQVGTGGGGGGGGTSASGPIPAKVVATISARVSGP